MADLIILQVLQTHYFNERESGYRQVDVEALHSDGRIQSAVTFEARELAGREELVVTAGGGVDDLARKYEAENDDYSAIMLTALAWGGWLLLMQYRQR